MKLIVSYKSPTESDPQALTTIELAVSECIGTVVAPVGGLR